MKVGYKTPTLDPNTKVDTGKGKSIQEQISGFYLRGADNQGMCYNIAKTLDGTDNTITDDSKYLIKSEKELRYFPDDPLLTFEDSVLYGCNLDLDL